LIQSSGPVNPNGSPIEGDMPLLNACSATYGVSTNSSIFYNECRSPSADQRPDSPFSPEFLAVYIMLGSSIVVLGIHGLVKRARDSGFNDSRGLSFSPLRSSSMNKAVNLDDEVELKSMSSFSSPGNDLVFKGYTSDPLGTLYVYSNFQNTGCKLLIHLLSSASVFMTLVSLLWIMLMAILVLDYYSVFKVFSPHQQSTMLFYDHTLLNQVFIIVWHIVLVWFLVLKLTENSQTTYFARRTSLSQASFVKVEKRLADAVYLVNQGSLVEWVHATEMKLRRMTG
jgi:hypothetical protein